MPQKYVAWEWDDYPGRKRVLTNRTGKSPNKGLLNDLLFLLMVTVKSFDIAGDSPREDKQEFGILPTR